MVQKLVGLVFALTVFALVPAQAQVDPKAKAILEESSKAYKNLASLHEKITFKTEVTGGPAALGGQEPISLEIKLTRPNKLYTEFQRKNPAGKVVKDMIVSDGNTLWRYNAGPNTYSKAKAPATYGEFADMPEATPECDLLFRGIDPFALFESAAKVAPAAAEKVGEVDCDVLIATMNTGQANASATLKIFIGQKDKLLRGMLFESKGKDPLSGKDQTVKLTLKYEIANAAPMLTEADFKYAPPAGAKQVVPGVIQRKPEGKGP